jgi:hypothetical protein
MIETELDACIVAMALPGQPDPVFRSVDTGLGRLIGHGLFTLLIVVPGGEVQRVYTSNSEAYPISGRKKMGPTPWGKRVLEERRVYVGRTAEDIRWAFPDHALIASLGLASVINVPVVHDDAVLGTMNILDRAGAYDDSHGALARCFAPYLVPGFLALRRKT